MEIINLVTAILGLVSAIAAIYTIKNKKMKKNDTSQDKAIKGIFMMFLILGFYFVWIIGFSALPKVIEWATTEKKDYTSPYEITEFPDDQNKQLIFLVEIPEKTATHSGL